MPSLVRHFEIDADDVERAKHFYETVFGWEIRPWGPPNYYLIDAGSGMSGDIRERTDPKGVGSVGFVCTITVDDLQATKEKIIQHGGDIVVPEFRIDGVGNLFYFTDTEGHRVGVMQRDGE